MQQIQFNVQDASAILAVARSAPINNMAEAEARAQLFARYQGWAGFMLSPRVIALLVEDGKQQEAAAKAAEAAAKAAEAAAEPAAEPAALP